MSRAEHHPVLELIHRRTSAEDFDPSRELSDEDIRTLVADAIRAPSSFNIQHWRFVAVRSARDRERLRAAAFGQSQVGRAPVTFIVLGDTRADERLPAIMDQAVRGGALPERKARAWVRMAREIYADPGLARDEAIRSASLAAMTMMLAAEARGWSSCALTGFDPAAVVEAFAIDDRYVPVMLVAVGYPSGDPVARMPRLSVSEVLDFDRGSRSSDPSR